MSDQENTQEKKQEEQKQEQKPQLEIQIDNETAFQLKLQEFDKNIATVECQVADLKRQKLEFVYNRNVQMITEQYKQNMMRKQIEEETAKKLAQADVKAAT